MGKAIESKDTEDDQQWLTFWVVFPLVAAAEKVSWILIYIPFFYELKLALVCYLMFFNGAATVYPTFLRPLFRDNEKQIDALAQNAKEQMADGLETAREAAVKRAADAREKLGDAEFYKQAGANAADFIQKYGSAAYETAMAMNKNDEKAPSQAEQWERQQEKPNTSAVNVVQPEEKKQK